MMLTSKNKIVYNIKFKKNFNHYLNLCISIFLLTEYLPKII